MEEEKDRNPVYVCVVVSAVGIFPALALCGGFSLSCYTKRLDGLSLVNSTMSLVPTPQKARPG